MQNPIPDTQTGSLSALGEADAMHEQLVFHEVDRDRWKDLERLFESRGSPKYCWCMAWRSMPRETSQTGNQTKKAALESRVRDSVPVGILGYLGGEPVAWCSIAPRPTYRELGGKKDRAEEPDSIWSLVCFFVVRRFRRQGITQLLIQAAVDYARSMGATVIEPIPCVQTPQAIASWGLSPPLRPLASMKWDLPAPGAM